MLFRSLSLVIALLCLFTLLFNCHTFSQISHFRLSSILCAKVKCPESRGKAESGTERRRALLTLLSERRPIKESKVLAKFSSADQSVNIDRAHVTRRGNKMAEVTAQH